MAALETAGPDVAARVALIDALRLAWRQCRTETRPSLAWLKTGRAPTTLAETAARLRALASLAPADQKDAVARV